MTLKRFWLAAVLVVGVDVPVKLVRLPVVSDEAVISKASAVVAFDVQDTVVPSSDKVASPITEAEVNLANLLVVPVPVMPVAPVQVTTLFEPSTQRFVPEPEDRPEKVTVELAARVVNAPVPRVVAPILAKFAAPAPEMFQFESFKTRSVPVVRPMVIVPVDEPVPILVAVAPVSFIVVAPRTRVVPKIVVVSNEEPMFIVSAEVLSVEIFVILPPVPVAMLTVFGLSPVPRFTSPVVPESKVSELVEVERIVPALGKTICEFTFKLPVEST